MRKLLKRIMQLMPLVVVAAFYIWSVLSIWHREYLADKIISGKKVITLAHWQLEPGVRKAFDQLAKEYQKLHPDVEIVQQAIPESGYGSWVGTQLMGGTAPELIQIGGSLPPPIWLSYLNRYFMRLTSQAAKPNPYNAGTDLADVPLSATYKDGMASGYNTEMQEYMQIPLGIASVRICYNKSLLRKLTGLDKAPKDYREFINACEEINAHKGPDGRNYIPIANSLYHFPHWDQRLLMPISYSALNKADFNRDGFLGNDEQFVAIKSGILDFDFPAYKAMFKMMREIIDNSQSGFTGLSRDEAVFLFAQQKAVFISTGQWDFRGLMELAKGKFEAGLMDFPIASKDDPEYGEFAVGPRFERLAIGFTFGVNRSAKHPDIALDFLLFLASKKRNEEFIGIIGWVPAIVGTRTLPELKVFEPRTKGVFGAFNVNIGGETSVRWHQMLDLYKVKKTDFEGLKKMFVPYYIERGMVDYIEQRKDWRRGLARTERSRVGWRSALILPDGCREGSGGFKYRKGLGRVLFPEIERNRIFNFIQKGPKKKDMAPYEYSSDVKKIIKRRLAGKRRRKALELKSRLDKTPKN